MKKISLWSMLNKILYNSTQQLKKKSTLNQKIQVMKSAKKTVLNKNENNKRKLKQKKGMTMELQLEMIRLLNLPTHKKALKLHFKMYLSFLKITISLTQVAKSAIYS